MQRRGASNRVASVVHASILVLTGCLALAVPNPTSAPHQATGVKIGEVTDTSAILWTRLTASTTRNQDGLVISGKVDLTAPKPVTVPVAALEGACPGAPGRVRVRFGLREDLSEARTTPWARVSAAHDFTHQFHLRGLKADSTYFFAVETAGPDGTPLGSPLRGRFRTAPPPDRPTELTFCVVTCFLYYTLDHPEGFNIFPAMGRLQPRFVVFTGDNVYYDGAEPCAVNVELARYHWQRTFSLPRAVELLRSTPTYWEKDDHDTLRNDCWPGMMLGRLTFADGQRLFREQVPIGPRGWRTFRWGRDLQIWLTEGRDHRSPNTDPDGPRKTIWGARQKAWLKRTLKASDATWKLLISPTPIVGPDSPTKNDNHANAAFRHDGDEIRAWFQANLPENFFVVCGDRHWQYHSVHPQTRLHEFSVGPATDWAAAGTPGFDPQWHRFHRLGGGFLSVTVRGEGRQSVIRFEHRDVSGSVVYAWESRTPVRD